MKKVIETLVEGLSNLAIIAVSAASLALAVVLVKFILQLTEGGLV